MKKTLTALIIVFLGCQSSSKKQVNNYDIKDFFNNISVYGGSFSSDEERLIYSSNESGIYNVYEVGISSGAITKLSSSELESFFVQSYVPASNDFIYTADKGGNEINHLYLQKRGGQTIDLTPGENEKSIFYKWSQDNTFLYYLSNKRDSKYFDLYKMDIGRLESRMVYENKDNLSLSSISNNEQYLLLSERLTTSENKFYLFDIIKGEKKEISTAPGSYSAAGFSNDNKGFYYITDVGKEFTYLNKYDIKTSESTVVFETNWDVMYSYSSKNEKYRIIGINEDGKNSIQVIDSN